MGCGKSKHDVASDNTTILQRKKFSVAFKENETETKDVNNNVDNTSSAAEEQKESESVKEAGVEENKDDAAKDVKDSEAMEKINDEGKKEEDVVEEPSKEIEKNDEEKKENDVVEEPSAEVEKKDEHASIKNDEKINADDAAGTEEEKKLAEENEKGVHNKPIEFS